MSSPKVAHSGIKVTPSVLQASGFFTPKGPPSAASLRESSPNDVKKQISFPRQDAAQHPRPETPRTFGAKKIAMNALLTFVSANEVKKRLPTRVTATL
jgi:hypothetical protein